MKIRLPVIFAMFLTTACAAGPATQPVADLPSAVAATPAGGTLNVPKGTYVLKAAVLLAKPGVHVILNGSTIVGAPKVGGSQPPVFAFLAPNCLVDGGNGTGNGICDSCGVFAESRAANCTIENFKLGLTPGVPNGSVDQAYITQGGGAGFVARNIQAGVTATVSFYIAQNGGALYNCTGKGSLGEADLRIDSPGPDSSGKPIVPAGIIISGGSFAQVDPLKQTIEDRTGGGSFIGVTINGDMVTGQGTPSTPPQKPGDLGTLIFQACKFINQAPGNPYLGIRYGSIVQLDAATTFEQPAKPTTVAVVVSGGQLIHVPATQPTK